MCSRVRADYTLKLFLVIVVQISLVRFRIKILYSAGLPESRIDLVDHLRFIKEVCAMALKLGEELLYSFSSFLGMAGPCWVDRSVVPRYVILRILKGPDGEVNTLISL